MSVGSLLLYAKVNLSQAVLLFIGFRPLVLAFAYIRNHHGSRKTPFTVLPFLFYLFDLLLILLPLLFHLICNATCFLRIFTYTNITYREIKHNSKLAGGSLEDSSLPILQ